MHRRKIDLEDLGCLGMIVKFILAAGLLVSIYGIFLLSFELFKYYVAQTNVIDLINQKGELYVSPSSAVANTPLALKGWDSIEGVYGSNNGINLIISSPPIYREVIICEKSDTYPDWKSFGRTGGVSSKEIIVKKDVLFPSELFQSSIKDIKCKIVGNLVFPQKTDYGKFTILEKSFSQAVDLHIISETSYKELMEKSIWEYRRPILLRLSICLCYVLIFFTLEYFFGFAGMDL